MALQTDTRKLFSYAFILVISFVFVLSFGPGSRGCEARQDSSPTAAATVNGKEIPLRDFNQVLAQQLEMYRSNRIPVPQEMVAQRLMESMVELELLAQEAERRGIATSDQEVLEELQKDTSFHKDGKFSYERYREVLNDFLRKTPTDYERDLRRRASAAKLRTLITGAAQVSDEEVKAAFQREQNTADLTYVRFLPTMYASKVPAPKPGELEKFKSERAAEIAAAYERDKLSYHLPEQIKARHILLRAGREASEEQKKQAREKLENTRKELEGGKDFATLAKTVSEDVGTKEAGGELGWVEKMAMPPSVADAAFALKPGEMTQVVESPFGFHLVKVEDKKPPATRELKEVEPEIAKTLWTREKAKDLAKADAEKALAALKPGQKLSAKYPPEKQGQPAVQRYETETRPEAVSTGAFNVGATELPHLGMATELHGEVFKTTEPKLLGRVFPVGEGFVIAEVTERKVPSDADFAAQLETLRNQARLSRQNQTLESFLKALRKNAQITTNEQAVAAVAGS